MKRALTAIGHPALLSFVALRTINAQLWLARVSPFRARDPLRPVAFEGFRRISWVTRVRRHPILLSLCTNCTGEAQHRCIGDRLDSARAVLDAVHRGAGEGPFTAPQD